MAHAYAMKLKILDIQVWCMIIILNVKNILDILLSLRNYSRGLRVMIKIYYIDFYNSNKTKALYSIAILGGLRFNCLVKYF